MNDKEIEKLSNENEVETNENLSSDSSDVLVSKENTFKIALNKIINGSKIAWKWLVSHVFKPLGKYLKGIAYDLKRSISENPGIICFLLVALPGIFIGLFLSQHVNACNIFPKEDGIVGLELFIMELAGCLNMVWGFSIMKKRNLKSSIYATITTAIMVVCGVLWVRSFLKYNGPWPADFKSDIITSIVCVIISMVTPVIGTIGSFFTRNKNYKKDTL